MPAYRAAATLRSVYSKIQKQAIHEMFLIDDSADDATQQEAKTLGIPYFRNPQNLGYGGNVKKCLETALALGGDVIVELHPDDQYDPTVIPEALETLARGYDFVLGSRFLKSGEALGHHMPIWKYVINRLSTIPARMVLQAPLTDFHTGFRVYHRRFLEQVPFQNNHNDYLFSFEIIAQACFVGAKMAEVPVICRYYDNVTQINFRKSMIYGAGVCQVLKEYRAAKRGVLSPVFHRIGKEKSHAYQAM